MSSRSMFPGCDASSKTTARTRSSRPFAVTAISLKDDMGLLKDDMGLFSIKRRIVGAVVVTELILVVCLLLLAGYMIRSHAIRSFDASLHGRAMSIAALIR